MSSKFNYASSAVIGNKIFRIGGECGTTKKTTDSVEYFEPEKFAWYSLKPLCKPISRHTSFVISNMIYVTPGEGCANMQRYDPREPQSGEYSSLKEKDPIVTAFSAASTCGGNILCCGGIDNAENYIKSCRIFDISMDKWRDVGELPIEVSQGSLVELKETVMYLGGWARRGEKSIYFYSKSENVWRESEYGLPNDSCDFSTIIF